jgi:hypothetical protein
MTLPVLSIEIATSKKYILNVFSLLKNSCRSRAYKNPIGVVKINKMMAMQKSKKLLNKLMVGSFFIKIFFRAFST